MFNCYFSFFIYFRSFIPIRQLSNNLERIILIKLLNTDVKVYDFFKVIQVDLAMGDLLLHYDYAIGDRFIIDLAGLTLGHLQKFNPVLLAKGAKIFMVSYFQVFTNV